MAATATAPDPNEIAPKTDCWTILPNLTNFKLKWIMQTICYSVCAMKIGTYPLHNKDWRDSHEYIQNKYGLTGLWMGQGQ